MNTFIRTTLRKALPLLLCLLISGAASYFAVFKLSLLPYGYSIISQQKDSIIVKSYNSFGIGKAVKTVTFSENDTWKIDEIKQAVKRQKEFLCLFLFITSLSVFTLVFKLRKGEKLWGAFWGSNIISMLIPLIPLVSSVKLVQHYLS